MQSEFKGFFNNLALGKLAFPNCKSCGAFHWYPMKYCPHCQSANIHWQPVGGIGRVYSWTVVRHSFNTVHTLPLPYVVALLEFEDAPNVRLITNLVDTAPESLTIGMKVEPILTGLNEGEPPVKVIFRKARVEII